MGVCWSFLIAAAALKTPTRNGYNAQGVNLTFRFEVFSRQLRPYNNVLFSLAGAQAAELGLTPPTREKRTLL